MNPNKKIITEINRNLELMGVKSKNLLTEQPFFKFFNSIANLLSKTEPDAIGQWVKVGGRKEGNEIVGAINVKKNIYDELATLIGSTDPVNDFQRLSNAAKSMLTRIVQSDEKLLTAIYDDALEEFLGNRQITRSEFFKSLAEDLESFRVNHTKPNATIEDLLVDKGIDEATAKTLEPLLNKNVQPFLTWKVDSRTIVPKTIWELRNFWSVWAPKTFKSVEKTWIKGYFSKLQKIRARLDEELGIIQSKLVRIENGEEATLNIKDNLENIWFLIAGMRRSLSHSGYEKEVKKYIQDNTYLPPKQVEEFMAQDWVKNAMASYARSADEEAKNYAKKYLTAWIETLPLTNAISKSIKEGKVFTPKRFFDLLPDFERIGNLIAFQTPLKQGEIAELAMRSGRFSSIVEFGLSWLILEFQVKPALVASLRTFIENYFIIPKFREQIEFLGQLCSYGIIKDKDGNFMDCAEYEKTLRYTTELDFREYMKKEFPFQQFKRGFLDAFEKKGWSGVVLQAMSKFLDVILSWTNTDEFIDLTINRTIRPFLFKGQDFFWEDWEREMKKKFNEVTTPQTLQLKKQGFSTDDPKQLEQELLKKIEDLKKQYPRIEAEKGNFNNTLEDFKRWLREVNGLPEVDVEKAGGPKSEIIDGKKINYYLEDKNLPVGENNPRYIWFPNKTFYEYGKLPIN